jgi:hypothetical protein
MSLPEGDFNPFESAPAVPHGEEMEDDINFDQFLTSLSDAGFAYPSKADEPIVAEEPQHETEEEPSTEEPETPTVSTVRIGDKDVPLEEVQLLYEFGKTVREQGITQPHQSEEPAPPPPPAEEPPPPAASTEPPAWLDPEDEVQMGMWTELQSARADAIAAKAATQNFIAEQNQARVTQEVNAGIRAFHDAFPQLTDQEVQTIASLAAPTVSAFVKTSATPIEGIAKAMRLTALDFEPTRDRVLGLQQKSGQQKSTERKSKQGSLTPSSSGSAPRTDVPRSAPRTDRAATAEFARELAESYGANGRLN